MNKIASVVSLLLSAFVVTTLLAERSLPEDMPANPSKKAAAKHRVVSSWRRATFELEHGYVIRVEREMEKVTKIEVAKDGRLFAVPNEFYATAKYVDFTKARITRTDDPEDIPRVVRRVYPSVDVRTFGKAEFYLSLSFLDKAELEDEGVRFMAFPESTVLVMLRGLGNPIELDEELPQGLGAVTIASNSLEKNEPNQSPVPTSGLRPAAAHL